jgi:hypothetical protein
MEATVEFDRLVSLIERESSAQIPGSVLTRYAKRLEALREELQGQRHGYPLGAILVSVGAITDGELNQALVSQRDTGSKKLLGELLVEMHLITREKLTHALTIQHTLAKGPHEEVIPK